MAKKNMWFTQEILFLTEHWGKYYFWMKDVDGHEYMVPADETDKGLIPRLI